MKSFFGAVAALVVGTARQDSAVVAEPERKEGAIIPFCAEVGHATLVVDCSTSMSWVGAGFVKAFAEMLSATQETFGQSLLMTIFGMNSRIWKIAQERPVTEIKPFTAEQFSTQSRIRSLLAGGTHLRDAICQGINYTLDRPGKRAVIIYTDGFDRGEQSSTYQDCREWLELARREGVVIKLVGFVSLQYRAKLEDFIEQTGLTDQEVSLVFYDERDEAARDNSMCRSMHDTGELLQHTFLG